MFLDIYLNFEWAVWDNKGIACDVTYMRGHFKGAWRSP